MIAEGNKRWPPCRLVADQETTHRIHDVYEVIHDDPMTWTTVCGISMRSTRRRRVASTTEWPRADVLPPGRAVTCIACLAVEP